jgi:hypothetical protein
MTETQQRFLRAIAERVPMEHVIELHLFPPIRQGGVETGVAVVAEDPRRPVPVLASSDVEPIELETTPAPDEAVSASPPSEDADESPYAVDASFDDDDHVDGEPDDEDEEDDDDVEDDDAEFDDADDEDEDEEDDEDDDDVLTGAQRSAARVAARYTIHTARYRLTLKGVDRGKWEVDVHAEADAPLDALDAVVRGVQRRAGEGTEPDRLSADALREALDAPLATLER